MWAYEYEAGKFIAGEILGDTLYMYAPTGRGEKWVMNSEGIVLEYSSEPFHKSDEIIAGINAHYGTSFYQEDDIDKDFTIGETMPNWNAYEKIEMLSTKVAVELMINNYFYGYIKGDTFFVSSMDTYAVSVNNNGIVLETQAFPVEDVYMVVSDSLQSAGFNVSSASPNEVIVDVDEQIENWNDYQIIPK